MEQISIDSEFEVFVSNVKKQGIRFTKPQIPARPKRPTRAPEAPERNSIKSTEVPVAPQRTSLNDK